MGKISRVSLARKRELEKPDMILDFLQRVSLWVGLHKRETTIAAVIFFALVVIIAGSFYFSARSEKVAFDRLTQITPVNADDSGADVNNADAAHHYQMLNEKYDGTLAGKIAGLKYAEICYQTGDYEKAIAAYEQALSDFKDTPFFKTIALNGLGYAHEANGDYDQAVACFRQILDDPQTAIKDKALFHLGRLYELSGDSESSRKMFSRIVTDHPDSLYAEIVKEGGGS